MNRVIILLLMSLLFNVKINAQSIQAKVGNAYVLISDTRILQFDLAKDENVATDFQIAKKGYIFDLVKIKKETIQSGGLNKEVVLYVVKFWNFKNPTKGVYVGKETNTNYYTIKASDFTEMCVEYKKRNGVSFGALVMPIKLRFGDGNTRAFDFATDVGIGTSIGYKIGLNKTKDHYLNFLGGVGVSAVSVDSITTQGFIEETTTLAAFTPSLGLLLEFGNFQTGVFVGVDVVPNEVGKNWVYQNRVWLSVGVGVQILSNKSGGDKKSGNNNNK